MRLNLQVMRGQVKVYKQSSDPRGSRENIMPGRQRSQDKCFWVYRNNIIFQFSFCKFLPAPHGFWDLSSLIRNQTRTPWSGSAESHLTTGPSEVLQLLHLCLRCHTWNTRILFNAQVQGERRIKAMPALRMLPTWFPLKLCPCVGSLQSFQLNSSLTPT